MKKLYMLCGIPGSGKTTYGKKHFKNYVSRDECRMSLLSPEDDYFSKEKETFQLFVDEIVKFLKSNEEVCADATHINKFSRTKLIRAVKKQLSDDFSVVLLVMNTNLDVCCERNSKRHGRAKVPEASIIDMYENFSFPSKDEDYHIIDIQEVS